MSFPKDGDDVRIHYSTTLENGKKLYSPYKENEYRAVIGKGNVIKGLEDGILLMSLGEKARVNCPPYKNLVIF
jgi:FK506-binding protein 1